MELVFEELTEKIIGLAINVHINEAHLLAYL